ncbi:MAG TPA: protein kinase [Polyangia bacterium]
MIGKAVAGRFYLEHLAGAGGMGAVYRARDITDGAIVAVKILTGRELREAERFDLEAAILADLTHPAIVRYIAHGVEGGDHFIAMEWLEGEDLATRLDRQPLALVDAVAMARRAAEALAYAHARGIVHRDVKPENLFLPGKAIERLKVLDFGIARLTRGGRKLTLTGSVIGTPGYMAPELVRGARDIKPGADVFSLGCVLFQCLTGRAVFEAEEATALLAKILLQDAPRARDIAPGIPAVLDDVVARMLAKDPAKRLVDARAVIEALEGVDLGAVGAMATTDARRRPQPALTATEQRIACVVIAGPSPTSEQRWYGSTPPLGVRADGRRTPSASTPTLGRVEDLEEDLQRIHGARMHPLPDGSVVIVLPDAGKPNDQAARAARCALAVRAELPSVPLVVATGPGRFSAWSIVGEVIDNGMRLLRGTAAGAIRLDDMATDLLDARFEIRRDGTTSFLRAERDVFGVKRNLLGKASDFVGRGREMSMLSNLFTSAIAERAASTVLVTGAAGVGKSRLRQEFVEWVVAQDDEAEILFGIGDSLGAGSPFAMIGLCLRRAAGIQEGEPLDERRRKLVDRVARHVAREVVPRVAAFLGEIANVPFPDEHSEALKMARQNPQLMGDAMRRAWEDWLAAECAAHPVLLLLEDLHWGDLGTVSFIDSALRNLREQPFMVLALARPDVHAAFPDLWSGREMQIIRLAPLSRRASEKLVREALGSSVSDALVERIIARADGNAFYLEELIRAAAAGRHESLPDSVIGMVQARLDAEGGEARRVLRAASVFGERFSAGGVAALLGGEGEAGHVGEWLDLLATRELVARAAGTERRGDVDMEFTFTHALVREAAYAMLTDDDRALGHRLAGGWLEGAGSSDAMALAEHFRRGAEPARAVRWYERAAEQALKANDLAAAIERAELGISCGAVGEDAGALRLIEAEGHVWRGEFAEAERRALEAAAARAPGSASWLRAIGSAIVSAAKQGKLDVVEEQVARVGAAPPEPAARGAQMSCLAWGATYLIFGGRMAAADALMASVSEISRGLPEVDPQAQALIHQVRSFRASAAGDLGGCLAGLEAALVAFEQAGDLRNACMVRQNLGYIFSELGDFARAEAALRQALAAADRMGLYEVSAVVQHNLGRVLGLRGQMPEAARLERDAIASFGRQGEPRLEGVARTYLSEILVASGDYADAEKEALLAAESLRVAPSLRVAALGALARARLGRGDASAGLEAAAEAAGELAALGEIEEGESSVRLTHAEALVQNGDEAQARVALETARERLLARAARIEEPSWRARFLNDVPVNARILSLAAQWSAASAPRVATGERPRRPTGSGPVRLPPP